MLAWWEMLTCSNRVDVCTTLFNAIESGFWYEGHRETQWGEGISYSIQRFKTYSSSAVFSQRPWTRFSKFWKRNLIWMHKILVRIVILILNVYIGEGEQKQTCKITSYPETFCSWNAKNYNHCLIVFWFWWLFYFCKTVM